MPTAAILDELIAEVNSVADEGVEAAHLRWRRRFETEPQDLVAATRLGLYALRAGESDEAARALRLVLAELIGERAGAVAAKLYLATGRHRTSLGLDRGTLEGLARVLRMQKRFLEAGWCLYAAWIDSNPQNAQNRLMEVGSEAAGAEAWEDAAKIMRFLLQKHPQSSFRDRAEELLAKVESELRLRAAR